MTFCWQWSTRRHGLWTPRRNAPDGSFSTTRSFNSWRHKRVWPFGDGICCQLGWGWTQSLGAGLLLPQGSGTVRGWGLLLTRHNGQNRDHHSLIAVGTHSLRCSLLLKLLGVLPCNPLVQTGQVGMYYLSVITYPILLEYDVCVQKSCPYWDLKWLHWCVLLYIAAGLLGQNVRVLMFSS